MIHLHRTRGYNSFFDNLAHTVVISRKRANSARNTIFDTCAQNSRRYDFCDIFDDTVLISDKTVKSATNTSFDTCE